MSPFDPSQYGHVLFRSPLSPVEFRLLDSQYQPVKTGIGELEATLPPGIYKMQMIAGSNRDEQYLNIEPKGSYINVNYKLDYPSVMPLLGASTTHEYHGGPAQHFSQSPSHDIGTGGRIMIFVRSVAVYDDTLARTAVDVSSLSVHDENGMQLSKTAHPWNEEPQYGYAVWSASVTPGGYRLRWREPTGQIYEQALWVERGWGTAVFVPFYPTLKHNRLERRAAVIHMYELYSGFVADYDIEATRASLASEVALNGLRQGRPTLTASEMNQLLRSKFRNPMLGFLGAHNLLMRKDPNWKLLQTVIENLQDMVPDHPDLKGLIAAYELARGKQPFASFTCSWPPSLLHGYRALLGLDALKEQVIPEQSFAESIAPMILSNVWTTWRIVPAASLEDVPDALLSGGPALHVVTQQERLLMTSSGHAHGAAHLNDVVDGDPAIKRVQAALADALKYEEIVGVKDLILQVMLPSSTVHRALDKLGTPVVDGKIKLFNNIGGRISEDKILYNFKRNPTEEVRASVKEFKGKAYIDIRIYYMDDQGEWKPTRKGVSLASNFMPELKEAVAAIDAELVKKESAE